MPASERGRLDVEPAMNQRSSAMTARMKTRLVVRRGKMGVGGNEGSWEGRVREKRRGGGAKMESVPVPVLGHVSLISHRPDDWSKLPIWSMFAVLKDVTDEVEVLMLFVP